MDGELKFWVGLATVLLAFVGSLIAGCTINNANDNAAIQALVAKGANPIEAGCAIRPDEKRMACALAVLGRGVK